MVSGMSGCPQNADGRKDAAEAVGHAVWISGIGAAKPLNAAYPLCTEIRSSRTEPWLLGAVLQTEQQQGICAARAAAHAVVREDHCLHS